MKNRKHFFTLGWARLVFAMLEREGLDASGLFSQCGLNEANLTNRDALFRRDDFTSLWSKVSELTNDSAFGLRMGNSTMLGTFDVYSYSMMSSATLSEAFARMIRYQAAIGSAIHLSEGYVAEGYQLTFYSEGDELPVVRCGFDAVLASTLALIRILTNTSALNPEFVTFVYPKPNDLKPYEKLFRCPLRFDSHRYQMCFAQEAMATPLISASQHMAVHYDEIMAKMLEIKEDLSLCDQVENLILQHLPSGEPSIKWVATSFNIGHRTLQRRLKQDGVTFIELLESTRKRLAAEYVTNPEVSLKETTFLLGFTDHSNFYRSFKRWYGCTPGAYRSSHRNDPLLVHTLAPIDHRVHKSKSNNF